YCCICNCEDVTGSGTINATKSNHSCCFSNEFIILCEVFEIQFDRTGYFHQTYAHAKSICRAHSINTPSTLLCPFQINLVDCSIDCSCSTIDCTKTQNSIKHIACSRSKLGACRTGNVFDTVQTHCLFPQQVGRL